MSLSGFLPGVLTPRGTCVRLAASALRAGGGVFATASLSRAVSANLPASACLLVLARVFPSCSASATVGSVPNRPLRCGRLETVSTADQFCSVSPFRNQQLRILGETHDPDRVGLDGVRRRPLPFARTLTPPLRTSDPLPKAGNRLWSRCVEQYKDVRGV